MAIYRVNRAGNRKFFVETESLKFAKSLAKDIEKEGKKAEIRELKGERWYKVKE